MIKANRIIQQKTSSKIQHKLSCIEPQWISIQYKNATLRPGESFGQKKRKKQLRTIYFRSNQKQQRLKQQPKHSKTNTDRQKLKLHIESILQVKKCDPSYVKMRSQTMYKKRQKQRPSTQETSLLKFKNYFPSTLSNLKVLTPKRQQHKQYKDLSIRELMESEFSETNILRKTLGKLRVQTEGNVQEIDNQQW